MIVLLVCIIISVGIGIVIGRLSTRGDLEAARIMAAQLKAENEQYSSALAEARWQVMMASVSIEKLEQKLADSAKFATYWWGRAHPREFSSVDELKAWLAQDATDETLYIFGNGCLANYDCDDYAVALMRNALLDGYLVSLQIEDHHMTNSTIIGNEIYFIDPQTGEVWFWGHRDKPSDWCDGLSE